MADMWKNPFYEWTHGSDLHLFIVIAPVCGDQIREEDLMKRSAVITAQPRASGVPTPLCPRSGGHWGMKGIEGNGLLDVFYV